MWAFVRIPKVLYERDMDGNIVSQHVHWTGWIGGAVCAWLGVCILKWVWFSPSETVLSAEGDCRPLNSDEIGAIGIGLELSTFNRFRE